MGINGCAFCGWSDPPPVIRAAIQAPQFLPFIHALCRIWRPKSLPMLNFEIGDKPVLPVRLIKCRLLTQVDNHTFGPVACRTIKASPSARRSCL